MRFKNRAVDPFGIKPELLLGLLIANEVYKKEDVTLTITSINDSRHGRTSLHWNGCAVDLRTHDLEDPVRTAREIKQALGFSDDYDVVFEGDHIHLEYQPKG